MSSEKNCPSAERAAASRSSSQTLPPFADGTTRTRAVSSIPCSTSASDATPTSCGKSLLELGATRTLAQHVGSDQYSNRVSEVVEQIAGTTDPAGVQRLLRQGVAALGAERAAFVSFVHGPSALSSCRFMLDCEPAWCRRYLEAGCFAHDPWMAYAAKESEPVLASALNIVDAAQRSVVALAVEAGFASAVLAPAHTGAGHGRVGLLCLGHRDPGYFEAGGFARLRVSARALALELHDWWLARVQQELLVRLRITRRDLALLEHLCMGHSSKLVADVLQVSPESIDSRYQRLIAKLGVANRRMAAQLAVDCGLIVK
jgi:DNA-binding CsgD family transcriptional regulator